MRCAPKFPVFLPEAYKLGNSLPLIEPTSRRSSPHGLAFPQADAEKRVDEAVDALKAGVDRARRVGVILGFLTASILLIGGATAWWAAALGGSHRDTNKIWHGFTRVERLW